MTHIADLNVTTSPANHMARQTATAASMALALLMASAASPAHAADGADAAYAGEASLSDLARLGKTIFEDTRLSEPAGLACASCHEASRAFQGNNGSPIAALAQGSKPGSLGTRNTPTIMYMSYSPKFGFYEEDEGGEVKIAPTGGQFWDGRAATLDDQATGPMLNPVEMNNPSIAAVIAKIEAGPYADEVRRQFGADIFKDAKGAMAKLTSAIVAYEVSPRFAPFSSKFDDVLRGKAKFTPEEARGFALFKNAKKGNCIACHAGKEDSKDPTDWIFTDFTYDNLGVPRSKDIAANADPAHYDLGLCAQEGLKDKLPKGIELNSLCGAFKVPTLRNIAVTGPYFHNGSFSSLRDAVAFYSTRDTDPLRWYPKAANGKADLANDLPANLKEAVNHDEVPYDRKPGQKPRLNDKEIDDIVAFLKTLTDQGMK